MAEASSIVAALYTMELLEMFLSKYPCGSEEHINLHITFLSVSREYCASFAGRTQRKGIQETGHRISTYIPVLGMKKGIKHNGGSDRKEQKSTL
jgi:hypothetical protein